MPRVVLSLPFGGSVECASGSTEIIVRGELRAGLEVCFEGHDFLRVLVIPNSPVVLVPPLVSGATSRVPWYKKCPSGKGSARLDPDRGSRTV